MTAVLGGARRVATLDARQASPARARTPPQTESRLCARVFWGWLILRTVAWTCLTSLSQANAPLDLIEWLGWGHEWRWGYPKHPPLPAWIAEVSAQLSPGGVWGVYLASYLCIAVCLWVVWRLGREVLPPRLALVAALSLEGLVFFNYDAAEFSNNVVLDACWALAVLCFQRALRTDRPRWWLGLGLAVGLGLLSKYTMALLLAPMVGVVLHERSLRRLAGRPGPYLAALAALGVFAPHLLWMIQSDFITIRYGLERTAASASWVAHFNNPTLFALSQLGRLLPILFVLVPLTSWRWRLRPLAAEPRRDRTCLLILVIGPVALLLLGSLVSGRQLREIWGSPLWTFTGLLVLVAVRTDTRAPALARAGWHLGLVALLFAGLTLFKDHLEPALWNKPGRVHFPGKLLADEVARTWDQQCPRPFPIVGGEPWLAGNIGCYARHRPSVYSSGEMGSLLMNPHTAPWIHDDDLRDRGGVLVWDAAARGDDLPPELRERFPTARVQPPIVLPYQCLHVLRPTRTGIAFVLPEADVRDARTPPASGSGQTTRAIAGPGRG
jgi:4-amino-4-deoxy-L-arabinose transferase-like glycosyltransferase